MPFKGFKERLPNVWQTLVGITAVFVVLSLILANAAWLVAFIRNPHHDTSGLMAMIAVFTLTVCVVIGVATLIVMDTDWYHDKYRKRR